MASLALATTLWGASSAVIAAVLGGSTSIAPLVALGGSASLFVVAMARRVDVRRVQTEEATALFKLGLLEATNLCLYVAALGLGPAPVVVALHLTAPIILLIRREIDNRRSPSLRLVVQIAVISAAIILMATAETPEGSGSLLLAAVLALGSAASLAAVISLVSREAARRDPDAAAASQLGVAGLCSLPLLVVGDGVPTGDLDVALLTGVLLLGPGFAIYWRALKTVGPPLAGVVGLNEALAATVFVAALSRDPIEPRNLLAAAMILVAVAVEVRQDAQLARGGDGPP